MYGILDGIRTLDARSIEHVAHISRTERTGAHARMRASAPRRRSKHDDKVAARHAIHTQTVHVTARQAGTASRAHQLEEAYSLLAMGPLLLHDGMLRRAGAAAHQARVVPWSESGDRGGHAHTHSVAWRACKLVVNPKKLVCNENPAREPNRRWGENLAIPNTTSPATHAMYHDSSIPWTI